MKNKEHAYQGFETWSNGLKMKFKMHMYIVIIFLAVHFALTMTLSWFLIGGVYTTGIKYIFNCLSYSWLPINKRQSNRKAAKTKLTSIF